jgi:hypothetical protein
MARELDLSNLRPGSIAMKKAILGYLLLALWLVLSRLFWRRFQPLTEQRRHAPFGERKTA